MGLQIDFVVDLNVDANSLLPRLTGRRVCKKCGQMYHVEMSPPNFPGVCDKCGGDLYQRDDDKEETILRRFEVYRQQAQALKSFYETSGRYKVFDGGSPIGEVTAQIASSLEGR
jgi:adenylate kinase